MKTFESVRESELRHQHALITRGNNSLNAGGLKDYEEVAWKRLIADCHTYVENIDEVTTISIGATTNSLINAIQKAYQFHLNDYWQDFDRFIDEYVTGLTPDGKPRNGAFFGQSQCLLLGVGPEELSCFKGRNPMSNETGDLFRKLINNNYGTNIPMAGVVDQARSDWEAVAFGDDVEAKDRALMTLKEAQRDAGILQNGGTYYLLATDKNYQDAKSRCSGKNI